MTNSQQTQLEIVLEKASKDARFITDFYMRFCTFDVYAILASDLPENTTLLKKGTTFSLEEAEYNGKIYIPVFTSLEHLKAFAKREVRYLGAKGLDMLRMIPNHEVLLNPGAPYGKIFSKDEISTICAGKYSNVEPEEKKRSGLFKWLGKK